MAKRKSKSRPFPHDLGRLPELFAGRRVAILGYATENAYKTNDDEVALRICIGHAGGNLVFGLDCAPDDIIIGKSLYHHDKEVMQRSLNANPDLVQHDLGILLQSLTPTFPELVDSLVSKETTWKGVNLYSIHIEQLAIDGCDLSGGLFAHAYMPALKDVRLVGAFCQNARLRGLSSCDFTQADLTASVFYSVSGAGPIVQCDFTKANLYQARLTAGSVGLYEECVFASANLADAILNGTTIRKSNLTKANLNWIQGEKLSFEDVDLSYADLRNADLREAKFANVNLQNANLREARLVGATFTNVDVKGADFTNAVLIDVKLHNVDQSIAKNLQIVQPPPIGPYVQALGKTAISTKNFSTTIQLVYHDGSSMQLTVDKYEEQTVGRCNRLIDKVETRMAIVTATFERGLVDVVALWPNAEPRLDTVIAKGGRSPRGAKLLIAAQLAWAEAFGLNLDEDSLAKRLVQQSGNTDDERDRFLEQLLKGGERAWYTVGHKQLDLMDFSGIDFNGASLVECPLTNVKNYQGSQFVKADLTKAWCGFSNFSNADFSHATMLKAKLYNSTCIEANFTQTNLKDAKCTQANLRNAIFHNADLTDADLSEAHIEGADFTGATLKGANFKNAICDAQTKFPKGFEPPATILGYQGKLGSDLKPGSLDFDQFIKKLNELFDAERLDKASKMLKKDKFQLFTHIDTESVHGIVRSQSDAELVYVTQLTDKGHFACGTQNLKPCGGLRRQLCKHLFVLLIGLVKAGKLDPATTFNWIRASRSQTPKLDKELMSETLIQYKGAEAGEIDWRPTETLPEDFYAMS